MKLIDEDSIKSAKYHDLPYTHIHPVGVDVQAYEMGWNDALDAVIENAPSVDAEPVRHGRWMHLSNTWGECSVCGERNKYLKRWNYCPNCGAKMQGGEDDPDM